MKILIINTLYFPFKVGGAERSVQILAESLAAMGNKVRVLTLHQDDKMQIESLNNVEVQRLPLSNIYWPFSDSRQPPWKRAIWHLLDIHNGSMAKKVASVLDDFCPSVVHTNNLAGFSTSIWSVVKQRGLPLIHTSRDYYLFHPNATLFAKGKIQSVDNVFVRLWSGIRRRASRRVDAFVGISDYITQFHREQGFFPTANVCRIYNSVSIQLTARGTRVNIDALEKIGFIGRLIEEKGFDVFCDIAEQHRGETSKQFLAAGEITATAESKKLRERAKLAGVELLGHVDISDFLSKVSTVILPIKWNEPFGRVVVECALSGCDVYTSKRGGVAELFNVFPNLKELEQWPEAIPATSSNVAVAVSEQFSEETIASQYLRVYLIADGESGDK